MIFEIFLIFFSLFWFLRQIKSIFFWLYLWQLKEYHIGRFVDHFRTEKGKRIFLNKNFVLKVLLFLLLVFIKNFYPLYFVFLVFYFLESAKFFLDFFLKRALLPKFTPKAIFLSFFNLFFLVFYFYSTFKLNFNFFFYLVVFDILSFGVICGLVLISQIPTAILKKIIIEKAKRKRKKFRDLLVIAIAGSYGKTSTKEFLTTILSQKFNVLKTKEHQNSEMAISRMILKELKKEHQIFVCEMGAYNKGGIKLLCEICQPKIGIITGITFQHLALFGSFENLISAEGGKELVESIPENGFLIFNGENEILREIYFSTQKKKKIVRIEKENFDAFAKNIEVFKDKISFEVCFKGNEKIKIEANLVGVQNIQNLLLAILCAKEIGIKAKEIEKACQKISMEQGGVKLIRTKDGVDIIDSTYSTNPESVMSHLEHLKLWEGKKAIVMPCLIELGEKSKEIHEKIGKKIGEICNLAIITTRDFFEQIKESASKEALELKKEKFEIFFTESPKEISEKLKSLKEKGNVILFEGRVNFDLKAFLEKF
jgi:UDP-N-acetylmuramoyl-tripeptide--D-alanyl-D-alanine ligase